MTNHNNLHLQLVPLGKDDKAAFMAMAQDAFQKGFEAYFGKTDETILPDEDILKSLNGKGAIAYQAVADGEMVGGAVVSIDAKTHHNHLEILFVKPGLQGKGIGKAIWFPIERLHPDTTVWETCTPYFDRRNIHFYVNVCGFHIVEYFNERHPMPDTPEDFIGDAHQGMFGFRKTMPTLA